MFNEPSYIYTLAISVIAIMFAFIRIPNLGGLRRITVFLALGSGQIHLAVFALLVYLFVENGYKFSTALSRRQIVFVSAFMLFVVSISLFSTPNWRTISELFQLFVYLGIFLLFSSYLRDVNRILPVLNSMIFAAFLVAIIGILQYAVGISSSPHIYLGRGSNEGSLFILLMGVVPTLALFVKTKNPLYISLSIIFLTAQLLATSRTNILLTILLVFISFYLIVRFRLLRALLISFLMIAVYWYWDLINLSFQEQQNYSILQRVALVEAGWSLWLDSPWFGWGWGSTSQLAPQAISGHDFPHFHNTYIQLLVELGAMGVFAIVIWIGGTLWLVFRNTSLRVDLLGSAYVVMVCIALFGSGFTAALLFGADRAVQVMLIIALIRAILKHKFFPDYA